MKLTSTLLTFSLAINCNAQIMLNGYKCLFVDGQVESVSSNMYKGNDTFLFKSYWTDVYKELADSEGTPQQRLRAGLDYCFYKTHYFKTKDSLYITTGKNIHNTFYYKIYIPEYEESYSIHSNLNDADFSDKSKWLLSQIRRYRGKPMYFINEKRETCRNENDLFETP